MLITTLALFGVLELVICTAFVFFFIKEKEVRGGFILVMLVVTLFANAVVGIALEQELDLITFQKAFAGGIIGGVAVFIGLGFAFIIADDFVHGGLDV